MILNSTQESENNSGSFSFDEKAKRYEDLQLSNLEIKNKKWIITFFFGNNMI